MKIRTFVATLLCLCSGTLFADGIDQLNMGIGEDNVFNDATPMAYHNEGKEAGKSELLPIAYSTAPPQVPHTVEEYYPLTAEKNDCAECYDRQRRIGVTERRTGKKIPMPQNHYGGFTGEGDKEEVSGSRYTCNQCHVPQLNAMPLVENYYSN